MSDLPSVNQGDRDYITFTVGRSVAKQTWPTTLLIGKESIAFNDESGEADPYLEDLLAYIYAIESSLHRRR